MLGDFGTGHAFKPLAKYLLDPDKLEAARTYNMGGADPKAAHVYMRHTASYHGHHKAKANGHVFMSWAPEENPTPEQQELTAKRTMKDLGLDDHLYKVVWHNDRPHAHIHIQVCLVHPETGKLWRDSHSKRRLASAVRRRCNEFGFRIVETPLVDKHLELGTKPKNKENYTARKLNTDAMGTFSKDELAELRQQLRPAFEQATSWKELQQLAQEAAGVQCYTKGQGLVLSDVATNPRHARQTKLSQLFRDIRVTPTKTMREKGIQGLEERFGQTWTDYVAEEGREQHGLYEQKVARQKADQQHRPLKADTSLTPAKPVQLVNDPPPPEPEETDTETNAASEAVSSSDQTAHKTNTLEAEEPVTPPPAEEDYSEDFIVPSAPTPISEPIAEEPAGIPSNMFDAEQIDQYRHQMTIAALRVRTWEGMVQLAHNNGLKLTAATILHDGQNFMYLSHLHQSLTHKKLTAKFGETWHEYKARQSQSARTPQTLQQPKNAQTQENFSPSNQSPSQTPYSVPYDPEPDEDLEPDQH